MKYIIIISILLFIALNIFSQQDNAGILILLDGREYKGVLLKIDENEVVFEIDGKSNSFKKELVSKIYFHKNRLYGDLSNVSQIDDKEIKDIWESSKKWKPDPENKVVVLFDKTVYDFKNKNEAVIKIKKAMKILNEDGKNLSTQYFYYMASRFEAELKYGITIMPDGNLSSIEESAINDEPMNNRYPQYDALNRIKFGMKNVEIGSVFVWEAEIKGTYDELEKSFFIEKDMSTENPIEKRIIEISSPEKIKYFFSPGYIPYEKPPVSQNNIDGKNILRLEENNVKEFINDEPNPPNDVITNPIFYTGFDSGFQKISSAYFDKYFKNPAGVQIKNLAAKIMGSEKDNAKKVKLFYDYINRSIELSSIPLAQVRFTPLPEDKALTYSALNVLDKSYLFTRLCENEGIKVKMFLYRNNAKGKIKNVCPAPEQFDSAICEVNTALISTYASFENPNFNLGQSYYGKSGADALQVNLKNAKPVVLKKTSPDDNTFQVSYECSLNEDNSLVIKRLTKVIGPEEADWRTKRFLTKDELDKWVKTRLTGLGNDSYVTSYAFINELGDFEKPVILEEKIKINNYSFSSGKNIKLLKLPGFYFGAGSVSKSDRNLPFDFGAAGINQYSLSLTIPAGYKINYIPKSINLKKDYFEFKCESSFESGKINFNSKSSIYERIVESKEYKDLKNILEERAKYTNEWIVIEK